MLVSTSQLYPDTGTADAIKINGTFVSGAKPTDGQVLMYSAAIDEYVPASAPLSALGSVFNYVGTILGNNLPSEATDLSALTEKDAGDYYRVAADGWFVLAPSDAFFAAVGDGLVFNNTGGVDKIDNTDPVISGYPGEIDVMDAGVGNSYVVRFAEEFKTSVQGIPDLEAKTQGLEAKTQNIDLAATTAGVTKFTGDTSLERLSVEKTLNVGDYLGEPLFNVDADNAYAFVTIGLATNPVATADLNSGVLNAQRLKVGLALDGSSFDANENEVKVGRNFTVSPDLASNQYAGPMLEVTPTSVDFNRDGAGNGHTTWGTVDAKTLGNSYGEFYSGGGRIGVKTDGAIVCDAAAPTAIDGFVIDGGINKIILKVVAGVPTESDLELGEASINHDDRVIHSRHPQTGAIQQIGAAPDHAHSISDVDGLQAALDAAGSGTADSYTEASYDGAGVLTAITKWTDSTKAVLVSTKNFTYTGGLLTQVVVSDATGSPTLTKTYTYAGDALASVITDYN